MILDKDQVEALTALLKYVNQKMPPGSGNPTQVPEVAARAYYAARKFDGVIKETP